MTTFNNDSCRKNDQNDNISVALTPASLFGVIGLSHLSRFKS